MDNFKQNPKLSSFIAALLTYFLAVSLVKAQTDGQVSTPCTSSMISTFTPCMNYITGSSANGRSTPSSDCCNALQSVMGVSMDCACLMITGGVPLPQIVNSALGLGLPRICRNAGVSLQCTASGVPLPPPGPLQFGAPPPPRSAFSPEASETPTAAPASKATAFTLVSEPTAMEVAPLTRSPRVRHVMVTLAPSASTSSVYMLSTPTTTTTIWAFFIVFLLFKL